MTENSKDISEDITHFRYYTKRKDRFFFTAWIGDTWTHIRVTLNGHNVMMRYTKEPGKVFVPTDDQRRLIQNACLEELEARGFLERNIEKIEDEK